MPYPGSFSTQQPEYQSYYNVNGIISFHSFLLCRLLVFPRPFCCSIPGFLAVPQHTKLLLSSGPLHPCPFLHDARLPQLTWRALHIIQVTPLKKSTFALP